MNRFTRKSLTLSILHALPPTRTGVGSVLGQTLQRLPCDTENFGLTSALDKLPNSLYLITIALIPFFCAFDR